jgi:putative membrane protein
MMGYWGYGFGFFGLFWMLLVWAGIIWFIIWLVSRFSRNTGYDQPEKGVDKTPIDIVKERYAKGEISKKEFDDMRKDLEK